MKNVMKKFVAMICMIATLCSLISVPSMAASTRKCYLIKNQNTTVYSNTSLTKKYGTIYGSDELTVISVTSKYCKVRYSVTGTSRTKTGYIATSAILTGTSGSTYTAKAKLTTYRRPGGSSYGYVSKNDKVVILGTYSTYTQIKYSVSGGYKYAFVTTANANKYLKGSGSSSSTSTGYSTITEGVYKISTALNTSYCLDVHNYATENGGNVEIYPYHSTKNEQFQIKSAGNGWYYIIDTNSGKALDVANGSSASQTNVQIYELNYSSAQKWMFISAGSGYYYIKNALGCYLDVQSGVVAKAQNVWVYKYNETSAQRFLLSSVSSNSGTTSSTTAAVQLNVPSYKQYDSRWKNTYIGSKTIGSIGCLVTSLAMKYSYHTGTTVYPNTMRNMLSFSNNDLYWSSVTGLGYSYTKSYGCSITNSMMSLIYNKLKAGRPVIIGGKKSSGSTHYVVITGYTGSSTTSFSSSNFKINDPNSSSRTTLSQFLATYPTVLRIIY